MATIRPSEIAAGHRQLLADELFPIGVLPALGSGWNAEAAKLLRTLPTV
jgi:hypothetical protein